MAWAARDGLAVVPFGGAPYFTASRSEHEAGTSYHFPEAWSARALDRILAAVGEVVPIDPDALFLVGFSAGAQFVHRYTFLRPQRCRAAAIHAAGAYTLPTRRLTAPFLVTVGSDDTTRVAGAKALAARAHALGMSAELRIYDGVNHRLSEPQIEASRAFLCQARWGTTCGSRAHRDQ